MECAGKWASARTAGPKEKKKKQKKYCYCIVFRLHIHVYIELSSRGVFLRYFCLFLLWRTRETERMGLSSEVGWTSRKGSVVDKNKCSMGQ
jgi:hypothetical protein